MGQAFEKFSHRCSRRSETWSSLGVPASTAKLREACTCFPNLPLQLWRNKDDPKILVNRGNRRGPEIARGAGDSSGQRFRGQREQSKATIRAGHLWLPLSTSAVALEEKSMQTPRAGPAARDVRAHPPQLPCDIVSCAATRLMLPPQLEVGQSRLSVFRYRIHNVKHLRTKISGEY